MNRDWYIEADYFDRYQAAFVAGETYEISAEKLNEIRANADKWAGEGYASENLQVGSDGVAHIAISGVLLQSASFIDNLYAKYFGNQFSTYAGIAAQIDAAEANDFVTKVVFDVDSPGGVVAGVDPLATKIAGMSKDTESRVGWMAASAAFYLASQADSITATNPTASVGSIGVVVDLTDTTALYERWGVKQYSLTSTKAPNKRPEPHSEEFKAQIVERLDALHEVFATRVAEGRTRATGKDVTITDVNSKFGKGGLLLAEEAVSVGMIDSISKPNSTQEDSMAKENPNTPDAHEGAVESGVQQERARVAALLPWMSADSERVTKAISEGAAVTPELIAELSKAAQEKAVADAQVAAEASREANVGAAAEDIEADEAPVVTTATEDAPVEESAEERLYKLSNAKGGK